MEKKLKVLMLNGSTRENGNIALAFREMQRVFDESGVEYESILLGRQAIRGCVACETCRKTGRCVFSDIVNDLAVRFEASDGLVIGSPVYYGSANGTLMSALQRLFYSTSFDKSMKVGASVVSARRSGCTAAFDELNKFFTLSDIVICSASVPPVFLPRRLTDTVRPKYNGRRKKGFPFAAEVFDYADHICAARRAGL